MADAPLPPLTGGPGTPPLPPLPSDPVTPPSAEADPLLDEPIAPLPSAPSVDDGAASDAIAALSPFAVLQKKQPGAGAPPPSPSPTLPPASAPSISLPVPPPVASPPPLPATPPPLPVTPPAPAPEPMSSPVAPTPLPTPPAPAVGSPLEDELPDEPKSENPPLPVSNSGANQGPDVPDKETLVKQAAEAHADPLILPRPKTIPQPVSSSPLPGQFISDDPAKKQDSLNSIKVESRGEDGKILVDDLADDPLLNPPLREDSPTPIPVPPTPRTVMPLPPPLPVPPKPMSAPLPVPPAPPAPPKAPLSTQPSAVPPLAPQASKPMAPIGKRTSQILAIIGVVLVLLIGGGGLFVLALSGTRIPVISGFVSGLPGGVAQVANVATSFVESQAAYRVEGVVEIKTAETSESQAGEASEIYNITSTLKEGQILDKGNRFLSSLTVSVNETSDVPVLLRDTSSVYMASFPMNLDITPATLKLEDLNDTLLSPALRPIPLEVLLRAVTGEREYRKVSMNNIPAAAYLVNLDANQLKDYFPTGSVIDNPVGEITFAWKDEAAHVAQPLQVIINAGFTYLEKTYTYGAEWRYSTWNESAPPESLSMLAETDAGTLETELTAESFVSRLGIPFDILPHGTTASSGDDVDTTTRFTPVIPSGDVIEVPQSPRALNPPVPSGVISDEAKARDTQRKQDLADIQKALEQYKLEKGSYPFAAGEVQIASDATIFGQLVPKYLTKMPVDPLNNNYYYAYNVVTDLLGTVSGYTLKAVLENSADASGKAGSTYYYYQLFSN